MQIAIMYYRRGKTVSNAVQRRPMMTLEAFKGAYRGRLATSDEIQKDKVELPGPDFQLWKTDRFYVAFKESNQ
jgi:hypothetical protein